MGIPLKDAPATLFDKQKWAAFCGYFESSEIALARISRYPEGWPGFHCYDDPNLPPPGPERSQVIDEVWNLGMVLIGDFKARLISSEITATERNI